MIEDSGNGFGYEGRRNSEWNEKLFWVGMVEAQTRKGWPGSTQNIPQEMGYNGTQNNEEKERERKEETWVGKMGKGSRNKRANQPTSRRTRQTDRQLASQTASHPDSWTTSQTDRRN